MKRLVLNTTFEEGEANANNHKDYHDAAEAEAEAAVCRGGGVPMTTSICIEVEFAGPQPSQGPGALLCELLAGTSVEAKPVHLERGRKKKAKAVPGEEQYSTTLPCRYGIIISCFLYTKFLGNM